MAYLESALYCNSVAYTAVAQWAATHSYSVGNIVRQLATPTVNNERCFVCLVAGTSQGSEPSWALTRGAATNETTVHWMECTALAAVNGDNANTNAWHASAGAIAIGWIIKNIANTHYFICTTAGTAGTGSEPSWNTTSGATTTDGTVTWTCIGPISNFTTTWAAPAARLITPWSPTWSVNALTIYVGDNHAEVYSGAQGSFGPNTSGTLTICVDHTVSLPAGSANLKTTASMSDSQTGAGLSLFSIAVSVYVYGIQFIHSNPGSYTAPLTFVSGCTNKVRFEQCTFSVTSGSAANNITFNDGNSRIEFKDCTFNLSFSQQAIRFAGSCRLENCAFTGTLSGSGQQLFCGTGSQMDVVIEGSDFSGLASGAALFGTQGTNSAFNRILFKDCTIPAGVTIFRGGDSGMPESLTIDLNRVDSGAIVYRNERHTMMATETTATTIVRTGGAIDGATAVSHQITTTANPNASGRMFDAIPLATWNSVTGTNRNVTLYGIANDSRVPNNDEFWFDVEYLGASGSPKGSFARGGKVSLATASALTADSTSAWDGAVTARANTHAYSVGDTIKTASNSGRVFFCTAAGTSAASEPTGGSITVNPTLNGSDKTANITLSNGNLTANSSGAGNEGARATFGSTTKFYFEVAFVNGNNGANTGAGVLPLANSIASWVSTAAGGVLFIQQSGGQIWVNGGNSGTSLGTIGSNTLCIAVDPTANLVWMRINNGNWNNSGTANPATGAGGISTGALFSSGAVAAYPAVSFQSATPTQTANFGASSFAFTPPSGFASISQSLSQINYSTAADGTSGGDGTAVFRAGCRFSQTLTLSSPQPQQAGYLYAYAKVGRASQAYYLDPKIYLS